ncbi:hypothetical protein LPA44_15850 [Halobacterium sp. KA-4]|uniref:hypothetical protein n=1 Tax=Halobacterium sp. KA-4 TaxID=2896367 RepID=UPI001E475BA0|nr:hypothetical protein [Halobacterium sp. KA-4]MCD2201345.1 hypothetical protein [Halobacterium sp. KA-4]
MELATVREQVSRADTWLESHQLIWYLLLIVFLATGRLLLEVVLSGRSIMEGLVEGLLFGIIFATTYFLLKHFV